MPPKSRGGRENGTFHFERKRIKGNGGNSPVAAVG